MPRVGSKTFGYDRKGRDAAKKEAKRTGKPIMKDKPSKKK